MNTRILLIILGLINLSIVLTQAPSVDNTCSKNKGTATAASVIEDCTEDVTGLAEGEKCCYVSYDNSMDTTTTSIKQCSKLASGAEESSIKNPISSNPQNSNIIVNCKTPEAAVVSNTCSKNAGNTTPAGIAEDCTADGTGLSTGEKCCYVSYENKVASGTSQIKQCSKLAKNSEEATIRDPILADYHNSALTVTCSTGTPAEVVNTCSINAGSKVSANKAEDCTTDATNLSEGEKCCYVTYTNKVDLKISSIRQCSKLAHGADESALRDPLSSDSHNTDVNVVCSTGTPAKVSNTCSKNAGSTTPATKAEDCTTDGVGLEEGDKCCFVEYTNTIDLNVNNIKQCNRLKNGEFESSIKDPITSDAHNSGVKVICSTGNPAVVSNTCSKNVGTTISATKTEDCTADNTGLAEGDKCCFVEFTNKVDLSTKNIKQCNKLAKEAGESTVTDPIKADSHNSDVKITCSSGTPAVVTNTCSVNEGKSTPAGKVEDCTADSTGLSEGEKCCFVSFRNKVDFTTSDIKQCTKLAKGAADSSIKDPLVADTHNTEVEVTCSSATPAEVTNTCSKNVGTKTPAENIESCTADPTGLAKGDKCCYVTFTNKVDNVTNEIKQCSKLAKGSDEASIKDPITADSHNSNVSVSCSSGTPAVVKNTCSKNKGTTTPATKPEDCTYDATGLGEGERCCFVDYLNVVDLTTTEIKQCSKLAKGAREIDISEPIASDPHNEDVSVKCFTGTPAEVENTCSKLTGSKGTPSKAEDCTTDSTGLSTGDKCCYISYVNKVDIDRTDIKQCSKLALGTSEAQLKEKFTKDSHNSEVVVTCTTGQPAVVRNTCSKHVGSSSPVEKVEECTSDATGLGEGEKCCHVEYNNTIDLTFTKIKQCTKLEKGHQEDSIKNSITADHHNSDVVVACKSAVPAEVTNTCSKNAGTKTSPTKATDCTTDATNLVEGDKCCYVTYKNKVDLVTTDLKQCTKLAKGSQESSILQQIKSDGHNSEVSVICSTGNAPVVANTCSKLAVNTAPSSPTDCTSDKLNLGDGDKCCYVTYKNKVDLTTSAIQQCMKLAKGTTDATLLEPLKTNKANSDVEINCSSSYIELSFVLGLIALLLF